MTKTHGMSKTSEYKTWVSMKQRCSNPRDKFYASYGGRGIIVCDSWHNSFEAFYKDMGPRPSIKHSLDRIDVDGGYGPEKCRWATIDQQLSNQRRNIYVLYKGERITVSEAERRSGLPANIAHNRLKIGWTAEAAVSAPVWRAGMPRSPYKRRHNGIVVKYNNNDMLLKQACVASGMAYEPIRRRIKNGENPQDVFDAAYEKGKLLHG